jgi:CBS-domain-containing membrane protein
MMVMLPENKILEHLKKGTLKDAQDISDTLKKGCNLLVGSWDRVFRKEMAGHSHFFQGDTFIGNPWDEPEKKIGLANDKEFVFVPYEMTIASYPAFKCGVLFPETVFEPTEAPKAQQNAAPDKTAVESKPDADSEESSNSIPPEKTSVMAETKEIKEQQISETIQKMTQSPAVLPGEQSSSPSEIYAKDIMQKDVIWASPDDSVQQTLAKMQPGEPAFVLIGQDNIPQGIVSKSDATGAISPYLRPVFAKWRRPQDDATLQIKVKWIMSKPVRTINTEASLETMVEKLSEFGGGCLAVADQQGKVVGLVTQAEIFKALLKKQL